MPRVRYWSARILTTLDINSETCWTEEFTLSLSGNKCANQLESFDRKKWVFVKKKGPKEFPLNAFEVKLSWQWNSINYSVEAAIDLWLSCLFSRVFTVANWICALNYIKLVKVKCLRSNGFLSSPLSTNKTCNVLTSFASRECAPDISMLLK